MTAYYNEIDEYAAQWLRNLIKEGHIADGTVDTRSILDVAPADLRDFTQCHFFAGIGVWSHTLRLAGWPDDRPVWTGSCPCQPFSSAGKGKGFDDERHLWPEFHRLIRECQPGVVFGEQVASKDGFAWFDTVCADMEGTGYAIGAVDLCAAGVGAPHIRQRLWLAAERLGDDDDARREGNGLQPLRPGREGGRQDACLAGSGATRRMGDDDEGLEGQRRGLEAKGGWLGAVRPVAEAGEPCGLADGDGDRRQEAGGYIPRPRPGAMGLSETVPLAGWNTPVTSDGNGGKRPHPETTMTGGHPSGRKVNMGLASQVHTGFQGVDPARLTATGEMLTGSTAGMENGGQLNPEHSRWLRGLPPAWGSCAPTAMPSRRGRRQK